MVEVTKPADCFTGYTMCLEGRVKFGCIQEDTDRLFQVLYNDSVSLVEQTGWGYVCLHKPFRLVGGIHVRTFKQLKTRKNTKKTLPMVKKNLLAFSCHSWLNKQDNDIGSYVMVIPHVYEYIYTFFTLLSDQ